MQLLKNGQHNTEQKTGWLHHRGVSRIRAAFPAIRYALPVLRSSISAEDGCSLPAGRCYAVTPSTLYQGVPRVPFLAAILPLCVPLEDADPVPPAPFCVIKGLISHFNEIFF
jgi:hypothetical protein